MISSYHKRAEKKIDKEEGNDICRGSGSRSRRGGIGMNGEFITIRRRTLTEKEIIGLELPKEEYDRLISQYSISREVQRYEKKESTPHQNEVPKSRNMVDKDGFERAVMVFRVWLDLMEKALLENESFRIEVIYNAELLKTDFQIYVPANDEKGGISQES